MKRTATLRKPVQFEQSLELERESRRKRSGNTVAGELTVTSGRTPSDPYQPGMALLRLAQGRVEAASSSIRRVAEEVRDLGHRTRVLDHFVEIVLAAKDVAAARAAAEELEGIAQRFDAPLVAGF